ncbi:MAG: DUF1501 domain-containing protein [Planctomycetota bacterium]|nr:DUF1501 domain-containing protein [Planctomycetota bacterium]MDA1161844.1 DUF1501 domain-containing protein [Planctomycetota bacterium]
MLRILGRGQRNCDGFSRRQLLQAGGAGLLGLNVPQLLAAEVAQPFQNARAKHVIFLFLFGGPAQHETFDMKPEAVEAIRGPFKPIACRTPGLLISEHLPKTAQVSDKFTVIRTMSHDFNDHSGGGHYVQTGHRWHVPIGSGFNVTPKDWPSMGSVVEYLTQKQSKLAKDMPSYVVVPNFLGRLQEYRVQLQRPGETGGWLGRGFDPVNTRIEKRDSKDNPYWRDCTDEELSFQIEGLVSHEALTLDRMSRRSSLLEQFDASVRKLPALSVQAYDQFQQRALSLVSSQKTREALDLSREPATLRDAYGRHLFGQSTLMARRLIEAGSRFVTVHYDCVDGYSWDSHRNSDDVKKNLLPTMDSALSTLLTDLDDRGLLDETLVVCMGEMGRTPRANASWGRDHWSTVFPAVLAGAGIQRGGIYGETDRDAAYSVTPPVSPEDLAATIYQALGIDPELRVPDPQGRPTHVIDQGTPLTQLFA